MKLLSGWLLLLCLALPVGAQEAPSVPPTAVAFVMEPGNPALPAGVQWDFAPMAVVYVIQDGAESYRLTLRYASGHKEVHVLQGRPDERWGTIYIGLRRGDHLTAMAVVRVKATGPDGPVTVVD